VVDNSFKQAFSMRKNMLYVIGVMVTVIFLTVGFLSVAKPYVYAESQEANWQLVISGLVDQNLTLSLADMQNLPKTTVNMSLFCVDFPNYVVAQGSWTGVSLSLLLDRAGVSAEVIKVAFYARDGYSTDLTVETARRSDVILAYERDGIPLPEALRLVVPGKWGYKWISQISDIVLVNYDYKGKWESLGYSDTGDITQGSSRNSIIPQVPTLGPQPPRPDISNSPTPTNSTPSPTPTESPTSPAQSPSDLSSSPSPVSGRTTPSEFAPLLLILAPLALIALVGLGLRRRTARSFHLTKSESP
jgi:hypothetical protein